MRTNNVHEADLYHDFAGIRLPIPGFRNSRGNAPRWATNSGNGTAGCYRATVNESETIIEAQPFCLVRSRGETCALWTRDMGLPGAPHIERS
jgi:hypothetical protein